jgi:uncharacterized protein
MPTILFNTARNQYVYSSYFNDSFLVGSATTPSSNTPALFHGVLGRVCRRLTDGITRSFRKNIIAIEDALSSSQNRPIAVFDRKNIESRYRDQRHEQLILNVTEDCNFRCGYCLYGGTYPGRRRRSCQGMPPELAKTAVDSFLSNCADEFHISFYGGEPLLSLELIKSIVDHTERAMSSGGKHARFSLTTNCSLLTGDVARYLIDKDFSVTISLDGPASTHDRERVDVRGNGTHQNILENIERIHALDDTFARRKLGVSIVCCEEQDIDAIHAFFSSHAILSRCRTNFALVNPGATMAPGRNSVASDSLRTFSYFEELYADSIVHGTTDNVLSSLFETMYSDYFNRHGHGTDAHRRLGCCLPGMRRLFVSTDGLLYPCEKLDAGFPIGTVHGWLDYSRLAVLFKSFSDITRECGSCWAVKLCKMCFASFFDGTSMNDNIRSDECAAFKEQLLCMLAHYHTLHETDPQLLRKRFTT